MPAGASNGVTGGALSAAPYRLAVMTRLELLHTIQDNADQLDMRDAFALMAGRLPDDERVKAAWEHFSLAVSYTHLTLPTIYSV